MPTPQDYALFVGQVNKLTERRQAVTSIYFSVNAVIVGAIACILKDASMVNWWQAEKPNHQAFFLTNLAF